MDGPAGVDCGLDAVLARPGNHLACGLSVLHAAQPHLSEQLHPGIRQVPEVPLFHSVLDHGRAGMDLHAGRAEVRVPSLRGDRHGLEPDDIPRPARHVNLARRNHRRHAAVQRRIDPVKLLLARRVVSHDRVDVTVDQARRKRYAIGLDDRSRVIGVEIPFIAECRDAAVFHDDAVSVGDRRLDPARQQKADVPYHQFPA